MQGRRLLQDLSTVSIQQRPEHGRSSPDTQRVRPTDRQMSCQESQAIASADEATTSRNRVYGALTTALRPIQLSRRAGRRDASRTAGEQTLQGKGRKFALDG